MANNQTGFDINSTSLSGQLSYGETLQKSFLLYEINLADDLGNDNCIADNGDAKYAQANEHILYGALIGGSSSTDDFDYNHDCIVNQASISQ